MQPCIAITKPQKQLEDPFDHLPVSTLVDYPAGGTIYYQDEASAGLYLVMDGRVKVSRIIDSGHQILIDIYKVDDFFGESAIVTTQRPEQATAMENTRLMTWTTPALTEISMRRPRLAVALLQILTQRTNGFKERIESFGTDAIAHRLARGLVRFGGRLGTTLNTGAIYLPPLTHELLSQYVGTSREIVTYYMNYLRREGYLQYSRRCIILHPAALRQWMRHNP